MNRKKTKIKKDFFRTIRGKQSDTQNTGITLISLIITIIVLLILAGVTINMVLGDNGLFNKAKTSVGKYENAQESENTALGQYENEIDNYIKGNRNYESEINALKAEVETLKKMQKFKETVLYENDTGAGVGSVITFKDNLTIDDFDEIRFIYGFYRDNGWDSIETRSFTNYEWNFIITHKNSNGWDAHLIYVDSGCCICINNVTKTGFSIYSITNNYRSIARVIGIKY